MKGRDYEDGDDRITVDAGEGEPFVTITRRTKDAKGRQRFVESVCIGIEAWRRIVKDQESRS